MSTGANALEHGASKPARYLRLHRFRITLWVAAGEGLLVLLHVIPHLAVYVLAIAGVAFWFGAARRYKSATARQISWIFAASQAIVVLIPIVLEIAKWAAIVAIAVVAVGALVILFTERERL